MLFFAMFASTCFTGGCCSHSQINCKDKGCCDMAATVRGENVSDTLTKVLLKFSLLPTENGKYSSWYSIYPQFWKSFLSKWASKSISQFWCHTEAAFSFTSVQLSTSILPFSPYFIDVFNPAVCIRPNWTKPWFSLRQTVSLFHKLQINFINFLSVHHNQNPFNCHICLFLWTSEFPTFVIPLSVKFHWQSHFLTLNTLQFSLVLEYSCSPCFQYPFFQATALNISSLVYFILIWHILYLFASRADMGFHLYLCLYLFAYKTLCFRPDPASCCALKKSAYIVHHKSHLTKPLAWFWGKTLMWPSDLNMFIFAFNTVSFRSIPPSFQTDYECPAQFQ